MVYVIDFFGDYLFLDDVVNSGLSKIYGFAFLVWISNLGISFMRYLHGPNFWPIKFLFF